MYRYEKNPETGEPELIIDGWENGIASSPYQGITSIKNLNIKYLPGAVYSNYKRILNTSATTIGIPTYWTQDPTTGIYYILDLNGLVWKTTDPTTVAWTQLTGNSGHTGAGQGLVVYKNYLFVFKATTIDYYNISGASWVFDWQTGLQSGVNHMALWATDDKMYFSNSASLVTTTAGSSLGSIETVVGQTFDPNNPATYTYIQVALTLPGFEQAIVWLTELTDKLIVAAGKRLYPWDKSSPTFDGFSAFIKENIVKVINILNNLYITAGVKGNIYVSNGYSISPFVKIPDSFFGIIDPALIPGDMMSHRNKLYVGYSLANSPFTNGVFSISLGLNTYGNAEVAGAINFENQNSYGLNASGVNTNYGQPNVLIDIETSGVDTYASAWYDGSKGGMDTNDTTLYSSFETAIESDLIPVGTFLNPKTYSNVEFKLDEPLAGTIKISARGYSNDTYILLGTTTTGMISDVYTPLAAAEFQWIQFKIEISSNSTTFNRLREIRIR